MRKDISRRRLLSTAGFSAAGVFLSQHVALGEGANSDSETSPSEGVVASQIRTGPAGMNVTIFAVSPRTLRITVASIDETVMLITTMVVLCRGNIPYRFINSVRTCLRSPLKKCGASTPCG